MKNLLLANELNDTVLQWTLQQVLIIPEEIHSSLEANLRRVETKGRQYGSVLVRFMRGQIVCAVTGDSSLKPPTCLSKCWGKRSHHIENKQAPAR